MSVKQKPRLDQLLLDRGLVESRSRAQALILAGKVRVAGKIADKPGQRFDSHLAIQVTGPDHPYVSRGGLKLEQALNGLDQVDFVGLDVLDVGASTGGFTDCLLQHGAARVIALDVGYGQLHWKLRRDERVVVMERTNIRHVRRKDLPFPPQGAVVDVSFISLRLVLPVLARLLSKGAPVVVLVKPQFEAGRGQVGKGGVVRDEAVRRQVVASIRETAERTGFVVLGQTRSPILGPKGNEEFLLALELTSPQEEVPDDDTHRGGRGTGKGREGGGRQEGGARGRGQGRKAASNRQKGRWKRGRETNRDQ